MADLEPMDLFLEWNPPQDLLHPSLWPAPLLGQTVLVSLDFYAVVGGPYRAIVDRWLKSGRSILWQISDRAEESESLMASVSQAIDEIQNLTDFSDELEVEPISRQEEWPHWARVLYPGLYDVLGEAKFRELIMSYQLEVPDVAQVPWLALSYLPGFMRQNSLSRRDDRGQTVSPDAIEIAAIDWARFQVLYSPMDELGEERQLRHEADETPDPACTERLLINPAAQILPLLSRGEVLAMVRRRHPHWEVQEITLDWMHAAIVDELSESPRMGREQLLEVLHHELDDPAHQPQAATGTWDEKLNQLTQLNLVLSSLSR